jgi:hypothetical protein
LGWVPFTASFGAGVLPTPRRVVLHAVEVLLHGSTGQSSRALDAGKRAFGAGRGSWSVPKGHRHAFFAPHGAASVGHGPAAAFQAENCHICSDLDISRGEHEWFDSGITCQSDQAPRGIGAARPSGTTSEGVNRQEWRARASLRAQSFNRCLRASRAFPKYRQKRSACKTLHLMV